MVDMHTVEIPRQATQSPPPPVPQRIDEVAMATVVSLKREARDSGSGERYINTHTYTLTSSHVLFKQSLRPQFLPSIPMVSKLWQFPPDPPS